MDLEEPQLIPYETKGLIFFRHDPTIDQTHVDPKGALKGRIRVFEMKEPSLFDLIQSSLWSQTSFITVLRHLQDSHFGKLQTSSTGGGKKSHGPFRELEPWAEKKRTFFGRLLGVSMLRGEIHDFLGFSEPRNHAVGKGCTGLQLKKEGLGMEELFRKTPFLGSQI